MVTDWYPSTKVYGPKTSGPDLLDLTPLILIHTIGTYQSMLTKPDVLNEDATPEHELVVHRQDELRRLRRAVDSESTTEIAYAFGPPGTGKTLCAQLVADQLSPAGHSRHAYINCWRNYERIDVLYRVAEDLCDAPVHRSSTGRSELISLIDGLNDADHWVICDEADQLREKTVLYDLYESGLNLILIGNSEDDFFDEMTERLQSRLVVGRRIQFNAYSATEISAILSKRAEHAFDGPSVVDDRQLDWIAERVDGDARRAIRTLREASQLAADSRRERGRYLIADEDLESALPRAIQDLQRKSFEQLHNHQQTLHQILIESGPLQTSDLFGLYEARVANPRVKRTMRDYLSKMEHYNLVESDDIDGENQYRAIPLE